MRLKGAVLCAGVLCVLLASTASAASVKDCGLLIRNLKTGMSGEDVRVLQGILNSDDRTAVSGSGLGSKGNESTYFGKKTKSAVIKFQELYSDEVLSPAGLSKGSGFIGALTRKKLSQLCTSGTQANSVPATTPPTPKTVSQPSASVNATDPALLLGLASPAAASNLKPYLRQPASYAVHQGSKLIIYGGGYTPTNNTISVGTTNYTGLTPTTKGTLEVTIPSNAAKGKFDLKFSNAKGESNKTFIVITDPSAVAPKITSFTPQTGSIGTTVTVTGVNISKDWNDIVVGANIITGVASADGKTLTFTATLPVPGVTPGEDVPNVSISSPLWFYIVNPNGVSGSSIFTVKL